VKAVFLGATSGMGRALSRLVAERGASVFILGIPADDLMRSAKDLEARGAVKVGWLECDLLDPKSFPAALERADDVLGGFDTVVVTAGLFASQERLESDPEFCQKLLAANFTNTVAFCEEARKRMLPRGGGTLCVFSSVAGERGRKPVILYGAAKAGLTRYLEGLDHKFRGEGLVTVTVKPGFVRTSMTEGLKPPPFAGDAEGVARQALRAIDKGKPVIYAPPMWALVMLVIRNLPRFVMRRIGF